MGIDRVRELNYYHTVIVSYICHMLLQWVRRWSPLPVAIAGRSIGIY